ETSGEFVSKGSSFTFQLSNNFTITPTLSAELTGMYITGMRQGYLEFDPFGNISIGLRQMLLKNKMTLSINVNDIFYTSGMKGSAKYDNVNYTMFNEWESRNVNLRLSYNFGSTTIRAARNKSTGIEDETSRAGGR
ncbi:MAG: outer membrane beta-barrel family protein, partial [Firmicutes bacterium]|nr:outer membrane beta-barrel family protein [Bacillota bacterium]